MKFGTLVLFGMTAWLAPAQEPACRPVEGDRISARDLAAALPEFSTAPPEALVAQAPLPGSQRTIHSQELRSLAHRFGVSLSSEQDICFAWELQPLDRARAVAAMQESLQVSDVKIEITDVSTGKVPAGRLDFPLTNLGTPSPSGPIAPVLWRGAVVYGEGHRLAIWARVQISAPCSKLVAAESLKADRPVDAREIRTNSARCFPIAAKEFPTAEQVVGLAPLRAIAAGSELRFDLFAPANDVNRGDAVKIEVRSGAASLALTARALTGGRSGETISVRNPESNKTFQARVTGKGTAIVDAGIPKGI